MKYTILIIISFFLIFPSYSYDEKIKDSRVNFDKEIIKETIKINVNGMLNLKKIKKISKKYTSIKTYESSRKIFKTGERKRFKGTGKVFEQNVNSVVYIHNEKGDNMGSGSLINNKEGLILTNWHVIANAETVHVWFLPEDPEKKEEVSLWYEPKFVAKVIKKNKRKDLALIKVMGISKNIKSIQLGKTEDTAIGSTVFTIGHPEGNTWSFNSGMVSQKRTKFRWRYENSWHKANVIQHEVPTNPGNSGGPLLNENGLLVGVNSFTKPGQLINFSVSINEVREFLSEPQEKENQYIKKKKKPSYIQRKDKKKSSDSKEGVKKTFPDTNGQDANGNGIIDTWYVDINNNGTIDTAFIDDDEDGIIEAILVDDNENGLWEVLFIDNDLDGNPDIAFMDDDEDGNPDVKAFDYDQDGEWDKFEKVS